MLPRNNADVTHCEKPCSIFKTKQSTELKTGQQIYVWKWILPDEGKNLKFLILVLSYVTWKPRIVLSWPQPASFVLSLFILSLFILSLFILSLFDWKLNCRCVYLQHKKFFPRWWKLCSYSLSVLIGGWGFYCGCVNADVSDPHTSKHLNAPAASYGTPVRRKRANERVGTPKYRACYIVRKKKPDKPQSLEIQSKF